MLHSVLSSLNFDLVHGKPNNYEKGSTMIEKYTKLPMQLSYTKRSILTFYFIFVREENQSLFGNLTWRESKTENFSMK